MIDLSIINGLYNKNFKIAFISDTHLNIWRKNNRFFKHIDSMFENFYKLCEGQNIDIIVHLGDLFDSKHVVATEGLIRVDRIIEKFAARWPMILIPGNHDMVMNDDTEINLVSNYKTYNNVFVADKYSCINLGDNILHCLPYIKNNLINEINNIKIDNKKNNILLSHLGVIGFKVHENASEYINNSIGQIKKGYLKKFNKVFLGHYHGYQDNNHIVYVSAPLQSRHGDQKDKHGFVIYNTYDDKFSFYENVATPNFIETTLTKENISKLLKLKNHYIKIEITKKVSKDLLIQLKAKLLRNNYDIKWKYSFQESESLATIDGWSDIVYESPETIIKKYIDYLEKNEKLPFSKKEILKEIFD